MEKYESHVEDRKAQGLPPKPLNASETQACFDELIGFESQYEVEWLVELIRTRVPAGVDKASYVKAANLAAVAHGSKTCRGISRVCATQMLGEMHGGYNVPELIKLLSSDDDAVAKAAVDTLSNTILVYDAFYTVEALANSEKKGAAKARQVVKSWADAKWFTNKPAVPESFKVTVFTVEGETNTDDLSPAPHATTRPDEPLHALTMLETRQPGSLETIATLKAKGHPVAYVGDVIGTGSSRKSARNSAAWNLGEDTPGKPNKRHGFVAIGRQITPIFGGTMGDSGDLPIDGVDVSNLQDGDVITIYPHAGRIEKEGKHYADFQLRASQLDDYRAGGRILRIIGQILTNRARQSLGLEASTLFAPATELEDTGKGYTLAQKMVGAACNLSGVRAGQYCEPVMTTVGSQDTTGPMTRDELKDLACLGFNADFVLQTYCHTSAYPKPVDIETHNDLPDFFRTRGGVNLKNGDGVIHSWLNRMCIPDTVGTGGDSHTRFPIGVSFPAGSGLVAFAAALGVMPLDMPESVLVRFTGELQSGVTLRDVVNAVPYEAAKLGLLDRPDSEKAKKENVFNGRILEMEGLPESVTVEQWFEFTDAVAERSAAAGVARPSEQAVEDYVKSNIALMKEMIIRGYSDANTLLRRIKALEAWLTKPLPRLMVPDADAEYAAVIEINLSDIKAPLLAVPNHPDKVNTLSEEAGTEIHEVFVGSCMTNIGHYRAFLEVLLANAPRANVRTWFVPTTHLDETKLRKEGYYDRLKVWANVHGLKVFDYTEWKHLGANELLVRAEGHSCLIELLAFSKSKPKATLAEWVKLIADKGGFHLRLDETGCSLCMGNQARVEEGKTVFSTSTRNFNNRMGKGAQVYLGSAELAACCVLLGKIPTIEQYMGIMEAINPLKDSLYEYLFFDKEDSYANEAAYQSKLRDIQLA